MIVTMLVKGQSGRRDDQDSRLAKRIGVTDLQVQRAYLIETEKPLLHSTLDILGQWLADPVLEVAVSMQDRASSDGMHEFWVGYRRGIVDNESDSIVRICQLLGIDAVGAKVMNVYLSHDDGLEQRVRQHLCNPNIEDVFPGYPELESLRPAGDHIPPEQVPLTTLSGEALVKVGKANGRNLDARQMAQIREMERQTQVVTTDVLLEALDARWSDHCYHTTWKGLGGLLKQLMAAAAATKNPNIISMFTDNAGIWDFYDGQGIAFKAETHNSPSAISAYFGQLTKLGGVLRDILGAGLGADPVGVFEYTGTGLARDPSPIPGRPSPVQIAGETVRAIREYGNTFGTPMMWSRMCFHHAYRAKPFALGGTIGVVPLDYAQKGAPQAEDLLMLIGGLTGNDGIHGASGSSAGTVMDSTSVQIGSPLEEVKFRGAIIELRDAGCLRAITDVGGAGLNSAIGEMGDPVGIWFNTALVPLKTAGLPMWRILLSESQERMVLAVVPEQLSTAREILVRHRVRHTVVGKFTGLGRYTVVYDPAATEQVIATTVPVELPMTGEIGIDAPYEFLEYNPADIPVPPRPAQPLKATVWPQLSPEQIAELMPKLLADPDCCDQSRLDSQYDSSVQGRHSYGPYEGARHTVRTGYWATQLLPDRPYAALFAANFNPALFEANPVFALRQCFFSVLGTMVLAGSRRLDVAFCDNFYTPHRCEGWAYWLVAMVNELSALVRRFGAPVISGKDSSAGSVDTPEGPIHVPPAVFLTAIGKTARFDALVRNEWQRSGSLLVRIGPACASAAGSVGARVIGLDCNDIDEIAMDAAMSYFEALETFDKSQLLSGYQIREGGILALGAEQSIASGLALELAPDLTVADLLAEHRAAALIEISPDMLDRLPAALCAKLIGRLTTAGPSVRWRGAELLTPGAQQAWSCAISECLA